MTLKAPVALIIFNRPHLTEAALKTVAAARPSRLYVIADGPRSQEEIVICEQARAVIDRVDWDCEVFRNFAEHNLGCRQRIVSGLDWVFSQEDDAIILEDDCIPNPSFFRFCDELLEYYRNDDRVMEVGGGNYQSNHSRTEHSYYFSKYSHTHGWATWGRAWQHFDEFISFWPELKASRTWEVLCPDASERAYWSSIYDMIFSNVLTSSWDYQWQLARWCHDGLAAVPDANLVSNIGFGRNATHTRWKWKSLAELGTVDMGDISHPPSVSRHIEADEYMFRTSYGGGLLRQVHHKVKSWWLLSVGRRGHV